MNNSQTLALNGKPLKKVKKKNRMRTAFIIALLAYPVLHFLIFWVYINSNTIYLTFTRYIWS